MKRRLQFLLLPLLLGPATLFAQCVDCGNGSEGAFHATASTTIAGGVHNYTTFTIDAGVTVRATGNQALEINATGNVDIQGTLDVSGATGTNGVTYISGGVGALGVAGGGNGGNGSFASGVGPLDGSAASGAGAGAYGAGWSGGGGAGYAVSGGSSGGVGGVGGPTYGTAQIAGNTAGSGGGGGSGGYDCGAGGGGAGGGLVAITTCGTITISGTINANGGNGGSDGTGNCGGGGGGSGGSIWLAATTVTNNGSLSATGGSGGASTIAGSPYFGIGGIGSVGRIRIDAGTLNGVGTINPAVGFQGTFGSQITLNLAGTNVQCNGAQTGAVSTTVTGGTGAIQFAWSNGATTPGITNLNGGCYTVTVSDSLGCTSTDTICITEPSVLTFDSTSMTPVLCNGGCDATAFAEAVGGTPSYSYLWSVGATGDSIGGLCAGIVTVTVTDANGCTETIDFTIAEPAALSLSEIHTDATTTLSFDGTATVSVSGGTPQYSVLWSPGGQTTLAITNLGPGTYQAVVTDLNGCTDTIQVQIGVLLGVAPAQATHMVVYPNPTAGLVTLQIAQPAANAMSLEVIDALGRSVMLRNYPASQTLETQIDLGALSAGIYHLRLHTESGTLMQRITKN